MDSGGEPTEPKRRRRLSGKRPCEDYDDRVAGIATPEQEPQKPDIDPDLDGTELPSGRIQLAPEMSWEDIESDAEEDTDSEYYDCPDDATIDKADAELIPLHLRPATEGRWSHYGLSKHQWAGLVQLNAPIILFNLLHLEVEQTCLSSHVWR